MRVAVARMGCATLLLSTLLCASAQTVVPITGEPDHHLAFSNDYVRVFKVEVPPKAETLYHQHDYDYLYVAIGDADVTSTRLREKPVSIKLKDGEVELAKGPFAHKATNNSDKPFRNVTIELLHGSGESLCDTPIGYCGVFQCTSSVCQGMVIHTKQFVVRNDSLRGKSGVGPVTCPCLLVAISELKLKQLSQNSTQEVSLEPGEVLWNGQADTKLENSAGLANFILISFSPLKAQ